jgi:hypothetical protein
LGGTIYSLPRSTENNTDDMDDMDDMEVDRDDGRERFSGRLQEKAESP